MKGLARVTKLHNNELPLPPLRLPGGHTQYTSTYPASYRHSSTGERRATAAATCVGDAYREACNKCQRLIREVLNAEMCPLTCGPLPSRYYRDVSGLAGHESQVDKSELLLPHASPSASSTAHESVRFRVKTMPITSARFRLISHPIRRSISPGISKACGPTRLASHSLTDSDQQSLHANCTCHACAAAGRARCWHWLACDVQVHNTMTQTVVRTIARMRETLFDGPILK